MIAMAIHGSMLAIWLLERDPVIWSAFSADMGGNTSNILFPKKKNYLPLTFNGVLCTTLYTYLCVCLSAMSM